MSVSAEADVASARKRESFLWAVQTAILAHSQRRFSIGHEEGDGSLFYAALTANHMAAAVGASYRIPADMSVFDAAHDFLTAILAEYEGDRAKDWYEHPHWTGLPNDEERRKEAAEAIRRGQRPDDEQGDDEDEADVGEESVERTASKPHTDPLDDPLTQFVIRQVSNGGATLSALVAIARYTDPGVIAVLLSYLEEDGWLIASGETKSEIWSPSPKLLRKLSLAADEQKATERVKAEEKIQGQKAARLEKMEDRLATLHERPDEKRLLQALNALGAAAVRELRQAVPHLDRDGIVRALKRLREAGWVELAGDRRQAQWSGTAKLREHLKTTSKRSTSTRAEPKPRSSKADLERDLDRIEAFILEHPGCSIDRIKYDMPFNDRERLRRLTGVLHRQRRTYRRDGEWFPGKDPDWTP